MTTIRTKQAFKDAKINQLKDAIESREKGTMMDHLKKLGYHISGQGKTTHYAKGRAIISVDGSNKAMVTLITG